MRKKFLSQINYKHVPAKYLHSQSATGPAVFRLPVLQSVWEISQTASQKLSIVDQCMGYIGSGLVPKKV